MQMIPVLHKCKKKISEVVEEVLVFQYNKKCPIFPRYGVKWDMRKYLLSLHLYLDLILLDNANYFRGCVTTSTTTYSYMLYYITLHYI